MTTPIVDSSPERDKAVPAGARSAPRGRPSLAELRLTQRPPMSEGYVGLLYRQFSLPITWLLVQTPITANQISFLWLILGLIGVALMSSGVYVWTILGALLLQVAAILDRVDGEVARYKNDLSMVGVYLDLAGHILIKSLLFLGISLGVYRGQRDFAVIVLGMSAGAFLIVGHVVRFCKTYTLQAHGPQSPKRAPARSLFVIALRKLENVWWTLGLFGIILAGAITNSLYYVVVFYGIATPLWAISVLVRNVRELQDVDTKRRQTS